MRIPGFSGPSPHLRWAELATVLLGSVLLASGACSSKQSTGQALTAAGVVAVAVAVAVVDDPGGCREVKGSLPGDSAVRCRGGSDPKAARALVAGAGLGLTALGNELQRSAFDDAAQRKSSRSAHVTQPAKDAATETNVSPASDAPFARASVPSVVFLPTAESEGAAGAGAQR